MATEDNYQACRLEIVLRSTSVHVYMYLLPDCLHKLSYLHQLGDLARLGLALLFSNIVI